MANSWVGGCTRKYIIYTITAVILLVVIILLNFSYLLGRRFNVRKHINTSSFVKDPVKSTILPTTTPTPATTPKAIARKVSGKHSKNYVLWSCFRFEFNVFYGIGFHRMKKISFIAPGIVICMERFTSILYCPVSLATCTTRDMSWLKCLHTFLFLIAANICGFDKTYRKP